MRSDLADTVFEVYSDILMNVAPPSDIKGVLSKVLEEFDDKGLLDSPDDVLAYYTSMVIYVFYIEKQKPSFVLPELTTVLQDLRCESMNQRIDDFFFFDPSLFKKPVSYKAQQYGRKGRLCLLYGGLFRDRFTSPASSVGLHQLRWTGRNSFINAADLSANSDQTLLYREFAEGYFDYEDGFNLARGFFFNKQ
jgi:hypothetical protein